MSAVRSCANPGCGGPPAIAGECRTCYVYRRRTGAQRPRALIVRNSRRRFEAAQLALIVRRMAS